MCTLPGNLQPLAGSEGFYSTTSLMIYPRGLFYLVPITCPLRCIGLASLF